MLGLGAVISLVAAAVLVWWTAPHPSMVSVVLALVLMGLGLGFLIGSPINYLLLKSVPESEATSSMASMSLVRAVGTTLAPAILVGLLANSLAGMSTTVMGQLPTRISMPALPHAEELQQKFDALRDQPQMADVLDGAELPDLTQTSFEVDMDGGASLPEDLQLLIRNADVTTITERSAAVAEHMFEAQKPQRVAEVRGHVDTAAEALTAQLAAMPDLPATAEARASMEETLVQLEELSAAVPGAFDQAQEDYVAELRAKGPQLEETFQHELNMGFVNLFLFYGATCVLMLVLLAFIPSRRQLNPEPDEH